MTFRIAFVLCFFQNGIIIRTLCIHLCQHVICCTIQNACDLIDLICCQGLIQWTNDRNTAADTGLKKEVNILLIGNGQQFCTTLSHQLLVGTCYTLTCLKCFLDKCVSRFNTAHHFYNNFHIRIIQNWLIIMHNLLLYRISREISKIQDIFYIN